MYMLMKFYKIDELAELMGFTGKFIRNQIKEKKLSAVKIGSEYRITQEQLDEYIRKNTTTTQDTLVED